MSRRHFAGVIRRMTDIRRKARKDRTSDQAAFPPYLSYRLAKFT